MSSTAKKPVTERIVNATTKYGEFDRSIAKKVFRGKSSDWINNTVMRTARTLAEQGRLERVDRGVFQTA